MFAKIELREAWEAVQQVQRLGAPSLGFNAGGDATPLLESLRARLPAFLQPRSVPDRSRLSSVESFFRYTEEEGARAPACHRLFGGAPFANPRSPPDAARREALFRGAGSRQ